ncbi:beta-ketoacyl-ACP synthase III [Hirschia baltica]|uniref:Beta-ketoacyl-[acyl-carrier-protein] synthase III n=1 Tax=Hirschia baltica (strain ATCC 49814 / DSM 5838 / IFAM 1418) TaxID=582402 RepID=C6XIY1_HIRBI|nr:beta-ketoacyl-ACP synthase III [Hirschia baltica]ACT59076.1 3-oxoacyl-(acyl-carrier-protein) synthase III [Hirschia baltica ATCC 49814]
MTTFQSEYRSVVTGIGGYLPERVLTNEDLSKMVDTDDQWITERTGIKSRHIAADDQLTSDLGVHAAHAAMKDAGVSVDDIDLIICATATPDKTFPATAAIIQAKLGVTNGAAFDVQAVCSGFVFAMATADNYLARGQFKRALVIGAETFSRIIDWSDRGTCVLFGDGAGAVVLERQDPDEAGESGVLGAHLRTDGRYVDLLHVDGGPSSTQTVGHLRMVGNQVFKHAVNKISESVRQVVEDTDIGLENIDWIVPHQANQRILSAVARNLGIEENRIVSTVDRHGNTSAASVPLALSELNRSGKLNKGDLVLIEAIGGGLSWGAALFRL